MAIAWRLTAALTTVLHQDLSFTVSKEFKLLAVSLGFHHRGVLCCCNTHFITRLPGLITEAGCQSISLSDPRGLWLPTDNVDSHV